MEGRRRGGKGGCSSFPSLLPTLLDLPPSLLAHPLYRRGGGREGEGRRWREGREKCREEGGGEGGRRRGERKEEGREEGGGKGG